MLPAELQSPPPPRVGRCCTSPCEEPFHHPGDDRGDVSAPSGRGPPDVAQIQERRRVERGLGTGDRSSSRSFCVRPFCPEETGRTALPGGHGGRREGEESGDAGGPAGERV